jgi:hypothetical protein
MTIFHLLYPKSIHGRLKREKTVKENRYWENYFSQRIQIGYLEKLSIELINILFDFSYFVFMSKEAFQLFFP